jgi:TRAP-type mannitol/chloroaromatic compound transport system substrate-binding protein
MTMEKRRSLIITLLLDEASQMFFDKQRKLYFPTYANFTNAHLTLFHKLPTKETQVQEILEQICTIDKFDMKVVRIQNNHNFIAYEISSSALLDIHSTLQIAFTKLLHLKDKEILWPHITIQNKVTEYKAKKTHQKLMETFVPFTITAIGISSWFYTKNNWEKQRDIYFK